jgi:uncharacterized protein (DUF4415 family)
MPLDRQRYRGLKKQGKAYQTRTNRILRERMLEEVRRA